MELSTVPVTPKLQLEIVLAGLGSTVPISAPAVFSIVLWSCTPRVMLHMMFVVGRASVAVPVNWTSSPAVVKPLLAIAPELKAISAVSPTQSARSIFTYLDKVIPLVAVCVNDLLLGTTRHPQDE
jgi:hypothetical protein